MFVLFVMVILMVSGVEDFKVLGGIKGIFRRVFWVIEFVLNVIWLVVDVWELLM